MIPTSKNLSELIADLWKENFFLEPKSVSDVTQRLAEKGYGFSSTVLSVALVRVVKKRNFLNRAKKNHRWVYIQRIPTQKAPREKVNIFSGYELHERIIRVSLKQYKDGHYKEAIQNSFVEVIDQVKIRAGHPKNGNGRDLDGEELMNRVFGCENQQPIIKFNELSTSLDRAEQRGMMSLYKGVVGIRDKKAHINFIQSDHRKTLEYLTLASLLLRLLEENFDPER